MDTEQGPGTPNLDTKPETDSKEPHVIADPPKKRESQKSHVAATPKKDAPLTPVQDKQGDMVGEHYNSRMNISMTSEMYKPSAYNNLKGGMSAFLGEPQNQMVRALNHFKQAQHQQIEIKARIIKLRKEEEKAAKRIRDAQDRAEFIQKMHQLKSEKHEVKKQFYH
jgi:hypothetical protein